MKVTIREFMGCQRADIEVSYIALLGGRNAQGKSSTCRAISLALAGQVVPASMNKNAAGQLLRSGAAKGGVEIKTDSGVVTIAYPKGVIASDGTPPRSSPWAVGLRSVVDLPEKERVEVLRELIKADPAPIDFIAACRDCGIDEKKIDPIWKLIEKEGWDAAHKKAQDKGREIKAQWEYATGEKYGDKKAENWIPQNWSAGIEHTSMDALQAIVTGARADLEAQIANAAVDQDRLAHLTEKAESIDACRVAVEDTQDAKANTEEAFKAATAELAQMPRGVQAEPINCPHCSGPLTVKGGGVIKAEGLLSADVLAAQAEAFKAAEVKHREIRDQLTAKNQAWHTAVMALKEAEKAKAELDAMPRGGNASQADIDRAREALRIAEHDLKAWTQKSEADRLHKAVQSNGQIIELLSPDGVRRKVLTRALAKFNTELESISATFQWGEVTITPELDVEYKGRSYAFLSESEKFRARVTLQVKIADIDGSDAVVIDGADVLDAKGRTGLFSGLHTMKIPAVVGMTWLNAPASMPDMAKIGCGASYWVEAGSVVPLQEAKVAA